MKHYSCNLRQRLIGILVLLGAPFLVNATTDSAPVVKTLSGALVGFSENQTDIFLGIPYAKPPVDMLRWRPPQTVDAWQGTREAKAFGPACMQHGNFYTSNNPETFEKPYGSEDCLYLNIWKPAAADKRPVVVFIHGGSAVHGAASFPLYNGQRLAQEMDAVIVTINYRLAFFGNLQLEALHTGDAASDSGYFALLDQIQALEWVGKNIAHFGGDADNITVMGHSAGCASIWSLMRSPLAIDTFHKSICLSGLPLDNSAKEQEANAHRLLVNLLINDDIILDAKSLESYLATISKEDLRSYLYAKSAVEIAAAGQGIPMAPGVVDGYVLTTNVDEAVVNAVPTLMGQTRNEAPILMLHAYSDLTYTGLWDIIHCDCSFRQRDLFDSWYDFVKFKVVSWCMNKWLLNLVDEAADLLVDKSNVPVYRFNLDWDNLPEPWLSMVGVYHGLDVAFIFGNFGVNTQNFTHFTWHRSNESEREAIHKLLVNSFKRFIETGNPNQEDANPVWPDWSKTRTLLDVDSP